jgi:catechol 2,3-dioxygenase-like lactoylglutathione lyase family enzyme
MEFRLEVVIVPVREVDASLQFYRDGCGFALDVDYHPTDAFRVVQLTPPGSGCSIQIGLGLTQAEPGSLRNLYLAVTDIEGARADFIDRGVEVGPLRHKTPFDGWNGATADGADPERRDYATLASFSDPDDNAWVLQEIGFTA